MEVVDIVVKFVCDFVCDSVWLVKKCVKFDVCEFWKIVV